MCCGLRARRRDGSVVTLNARSRGLRVIDLGNRLERRRDDVAGRATVARRWMRGALAQSKRAIVAGLARRDRRRRVIERKCLSPAVGELGMTQIAFVVGSQPRQMFSGLSAGLIPVVAGHAIVDEWSVIHGRRQPFRR